MKGASLTDKLCRGGKKKKFETAGLNHNWCYNRVKE